MFNRIVVLSVVIFTCCVGLVAEACNVPQFHCEGFDNAYIYSPEQDAEESCKWLNGTEDYNVCLNEYNKMFRAYENGECIPILSEKHTSEDGETVCKVYYFGDRVLQRINCKGPDAGVWEEKVKEKFDI